MYKCCTFTIRDKSYTYGCEYDILFNCQKSQLIIFDTMKLGYDGNIKL